MSFAPYTNDRRTPDQPPVVGFFRNAETDAAFEYAERGPLTDTFGGAGFKHIIFMSDGTERFANVKKTVVHIAVDEDEYGDPVVEVWKIKQHKDYRA